MCSDTQLDCRGHACAKCGYCRDWYWRPNPDNEHLTIYTKRPTSTCIYDHCTYLKTGCGYGFGFGVVHKTGLCTGVHHVHLKTGGKHCYFLCECEDN